MGLHLRGLEEVRDCAYARVPALVELLAQLVQLLLQPKPYESYCPTTEHVCFSNRPNAPEKLEGRPHCQKHLYVAPLENFLSSSTENSTRNQTYA